MSKPFAQDFAWLRSLIREHVPCSCWALRLWRPCASRSWCLRATHMNRLSFMQGQVDFEAARNAPSRRRAP